MTPRTAQVLGIGVLAVVVLAVFAVAVVPSWRLALMEWWSDLNRPEAPKVVALFENNAYYWYDVGGSDAVPAESVADRTAGGVRFPNGSTMTVTEEQGLVWHSEGERTTYVLVERPGLMREAWAVAPDGSSAVLFNSVTGAFDVFSITYEGAYVSYAGSFSVPALPTYWVAVGYAAPDLLVLRTGNPDSFELYRVGKDGARKARSLTFVP